MSDISPEELALKAVFVYLQGEGFSVKWDGCGSVSRRMSRAIGGSGGSSIWVDDGLGYKYRVSFMIGELMLVRSTKVNDKKMAFDLGAVAFDIADPKCFDQVVGALRGEYLPEVKNVFDPSNRGSGGFLLDG